METKTTILIKKNFKGFKSNVGKLLMLVVIIFGVQNMSGQITQVTGSPQTTTASGSGNLVITKPSGLAVGDVMIVQIVQSGNTNAISDATRTGWILIAGSNIRSNGTNRCRATLLYKVATSTDVSSSNFSFGVDTVTDDKEGGIIAFSGVDASVFDVTPGTTYTNITNNQTLNASTITTATANSAVIMFGAIYDNVNVSGWSTANPGSLTELYDVPYNAALDMGMGAAWALKSTIGATGGGTAAISGGNNVYNGAILIALKAFVPPPTIASFTPTSECSGSGATVTITGANFTGATAVSLNGTAATSFSVTNATTIASIFPVTITTGKISVTTPGGTVQSSGNFTVNPLPTAISVSGGGAACNSATLTASGGTGGTIYFQGTTSGGTSTATASSSQSVTTSGTYYFRSRSAAGCWGVEGSATVTITTSPTATGVTICQNGNGSLISSYVCAPAAPATSTFLAGTGTTGGTGTAWSDPGNVTADDANRATVNTAGFSATNITSQSLQATNFDFAIPANAILSTIEVTISRFKSGTGFGSTNASDNSILLLKNGVTAGNNSAAAGNWPTSEATATYTGTGTLWGAGLSVSDINNSNFGVAIVVNVSAGVFSSATANINYVRISVTYTVPGSLKWYTVSSGGTAIGNGSPFNPVGVLNSGLPNTATPGTTTFYAECSTTPGCRTPVNFVITPGTSITTQPSAPAAICSGSGTQTLSVVATGSGTLNYSWRKAGVPVVNGGVISGQGTATLTLTNGTTVDAGNYDVVVSSNCGNTTSNLITVTVNSRATSSVLSGSAAICAGSPTNLQVAITGGTSPFTIVYSGGTVNSYTSGSNIPVSPLSTTAYTLTSVTDANGCVGSGNSGTATVTIDSTTSTDGGLNWSNGTPSGTKSIIFDGSTGTIAADLTACSLRLINNAVVTVSSGFDVTLNGKITVDSGSIFTLNNNSNLIQNTTLANSGNIVVKRNSSALKRLDYTLWSSPVTGQGLYAFSKFTLPNRFYVYDTNTNNYSNSVGFNLTNLQYPSPLVSPNGVDGTDSNNVPFTNGKGYLIRVPYNHPTAPIVYNGSFTGVANNGTISSTVSTALNGYNAVGNPYPSRLNVHNFIDGNANITGPLYFWRKTNDNAADSYATLTKTAYVANGVAGGDTGTGFFNSGNEANWVINVGQGFIVKATSGSTINFTNAMRRSLNADQFFRNSVTTNTVANGLYWLNLIDNTGIYSQMAVGYSAEGTVDFDRGIDGENINKDFYLTSLIGAVEYAIQGRPDFDSADSVPLSYKTMTAGNYSIAIDHLDGLFAANAQVIYLKDNLTGTYNNLNTGAYTFTSAVGTFNNRFEVVYQTQLSNPVFAANTVVIYSQNNEFVVNSGNAIMASIKVFDIRGRLIEEKKAINANQTTINGGLTNQVLLVQITSEDGAIVTKKVIR